MTLKLKTVKFQEMILKSVKAASGNKMIPITSFMAIDWRDGRLTLTTTDASNTLKILDVVNSDSENSDESFYVVVQAEVFSKLVQKTTSEYITLTFKENSLEVIGNGTYSIELPLDEEGNMIRFPEYEFESGSEKRTISSDIVRSILTSNKPALANTMEIPCLTGYYFGEDRVITTDTFKVCSNAVKTFSKEMLLPHDLVDLLSVFDGDKIDVQVSGNKILFSTENTTLFGFMLSGIEDYPVEAIGEYLETAFGSSCKLKKDGLLNTLDRLSLFVSPYDQRGMYMTFTPEGLMLSTKKSNGSEILGYESHSQINFQPFSCCVDIETLKTQIMAFDSEVIELWYGHERALKMESGKITQITALLEDDRMVDNGETNA